MLMSRGNPISRVSDQSDILDSILKESTIGRTYDDIADMVYKKLKNNRNWDNKAEKMIKVYTKNKNEVKEIMNMLRREDYFDTGETEF